MYVLKVYINRLFFKIFYEKLKKLVTFLFFHKKFSKTIYYCIPK